MSDHVLYISGGSIVTVMNPFINNYRENLITRHFVHLYGDIEPSVVTKHITCFIEFSVKCGKKGEKPCACNAVF